MSIPYQQISENVGTIFDNPGMKWVGPVEFDSGVLYNSDVVNNKHSLNVFSGNTIVPINSNQYPYALVCVPNTSYLVTATVVAFCTAGPDIRTTIKHKMQARVNSDNTGALTVKTLYHEFDPSLSIISWFIIPGIAVVNFGLLANVADSFTTTWVFEILKSSL